MPHPHAGLQAAVDAALRCYRECFGMAMTHCLEQGGRHVEPGHFRLMIACAETCRATAHLILSGADLHDRIAAECAEICEACAASCAGLDGMDPCVEACRACAEACRCVTGAASAAPGAGLFVRPAGPEGASVAPARWDRVDEASDESFPASDPPAR